jgi:sarcosine oxidase subunit beta
MAIGTSGNQFKNAGIIGKIMGDIISMNENGINTDIKKSHSYLSYIENFIDLSSFSRLRNIHETNKSVWS